MKYILLGCISLLLSGCPSNWGGGVLNGIPSPSNVAEDGLGQKYFTAINVIGDAVPTTQTLYMWDAGTQQWVKRSTFPTELDYVSLFISQAGDVAWVSPIALPYLPVLRLDVQTQQLKSYKLKNAQALVAADKAVEYNGNIVNLYQPSTGISSYLHSLPAITNVMQSLSLTANALPYQMLCTPAMRYNQWDNQTHFCVLANHVKYDSGFPVPGYGVNDVYKLTITVGTAGNVYKLISHEPNYNFTYILSGSELPVNFSIDYPMFASLHNVQGCDGTVDSQGNYHSFCDDTGDYRKFTYRFYDKTNPSVPLYQQVLP